MDFTTRDGNSWVLCTRLHSDHGIQKPESCQTLTSKWKEKQTPAESLDEARKKQKLRRGGGTNSEEKDDISIKYYRSNKMRMKKHMWSISNSEVASDIERFEKLLGEETKKNTDRSTVTNKYRYRNKHRSLLCEIFMKYYKHKNVENNKKYRK